ncbi:MAG: isochorismatase family protein [Bacteroidales bacterium]|nr:isochorismatase family protein [Bacteroidales bacterium]
MKKVAVVFNETASLHVEPQKGFTPLCPDELPVPEGDQIVPELKGQNRMAAYRTISKEIHPPNAIWIATKDNPQFDPIGGENVDLRWNPHCISGTKGVEMIDGLEPVTSYDFIVVKGFEPDMHPYSACYHDIQKKIATGLIEWYKSKNIKSVIVGGLATNYCVAETCKDLSVAGFRVILNLGGCRGIGTKEEVERSVEILIHDYKVIPVNSYLDIEVIDLIDR